MRRCAVPGGPVEPLVTGREGIASKRLAKPRTDNAKSRVAVVLTVRNDPIGCAVTLSALAAQTRVPDEIVVVDGGSIDATVNVIRQYERDLPQLRLIVAPGTNIARGRNLAVRQATSPIFATTDCGCRADPQWLARIVEPLLQGEAEFVAGFYRPETHSPFETTVALLTMRGQLSDVRPLDFNPSARSQAMTRKVWERVGGWPEWIRYSEDTLFDEKVRKLGVRRAFRPEASVGWRPRSTWRSLARQFFNYGTGRGHTQLGREGYRYNVRNLLLIVLAGTVGFLHSVSFVPCGAMVVYFFWWSLHRKARQVQARTGRMGTYFAALGVQSVVILAGTAGYVVGTWQRIRRKDQFIGGQRAYMLA